MHTRQMCCTQPLNWQILRLIKIQLPNEFRKTNFVMKLSRSVAFQKYVSLILCCQTLYREGFVVKLIGIRIPRLVIQA